MSCGCTACEDQIPGLGLGRPRHELPALRSVRRGLGDATTDLASFAAALVQADALWTADQAGGQYVDSIQAYQTAGATYSTLLDPQVKAATTTAGQSFIAQADSYNTTLQAITNQITTDPTTGVTSGPTATDAQNAHDLAHSMVTFYTQALSLSPPPVTLPPAPTPVTTSGGGSTGGSTSSSGGTTVNVAAPSNTTRDLLIASGIVAAGAGGWWWFKHRRRR
jgi:hypothetical protein